MDCSRIDWLTVQVRPAAPSVALELVERLAHPIFGSLSAEMEGDDAVRALMMSVNSLSILNLWPSFPASNVRA